MGKMSAKTTTKPLPEQKNPVLCSDLTIYTLASFHSAFIESADILSTSSQAAATL